jgi:hypothetical protein
MIAKQRLSATVDGRLYVVNPGEAIPPALAAYWKAANLEAKIKASGILEPEPSVAPSRVAATAKAKDTE